MNQILKDILSKIYIENNAGEISIRKDKFNILLQEINRLMDVVKNLNKKEARTWEHYNATKKTLNELDSRYVQLLTHCSNLEKIQTGLVYDNKNNLKEIDDLKKYKKFVEHIYSHRHETLNKDKPISLGEWVMCRICNKTFNEVTK